MPFFLQGVVLPFQKGKTLERGIEELTVSGIRLPIAPVGTDTALNLPDTVTCGQELTRMDGTPVVASVSGRVEGTLVARHPLYGEYLCADITADDRSSMETLPVIPEDQLTPESIIHIAREAAIYDELDGIPLWEKLEQWVLPAEDPAVLRSILVADATENDVYGSSAWAVLMEQPKLVLFGLQMAAKAIRFTRYHVATMLPKRRRRTLKRAIGRENVYTVGDEYPVTVYADKGAEVYRIGVQACLALGRALKQGRRHTAAIVTVAGDAVPAPHNLLVPFGTRMGDLLTYAQAQKGHTVVLGDTMVGIPCPDLNAPLLPGVTTVLALHPKKVRTPGPCIGCGRCADVCHAGLLPYEIVRRSENMHYERLQHLSPEDCDGCAACSYVCPAGRDVVGEVLKAGQTKGTVFLNWGEDDHE